MVLFDENPVALISETTNQFHIAPDKDSLTRISGSIHALATARQSRLDQQTTVLSSLSRRLNTIKGRYDYEEEHHDAGRHAAEMLKMDTEKFRIAKGVSDVEIEGERLSSELAILRQQLQTLEREGVEGGARRVDEEKEDEVVLKLQFYHSLGIDVTQDHTTGEVTRAVIRNPSRGDVNVVNIDSSMGKSFYNNLFWESL